MNFSQVTPYASVFQGGEQFRQAIEEGADRLFQQGKLVLFDPITHSNQCHLTAYTLAALFEDQKVSQEYLTSSFLINSSCIRERGRITKVSGVQEGEACNRFLSLKKTAEKASHVVNARIGAFIGEAIEDLSHIPENVPMMNKLKDVLNALSSGNKGLYPKFAGVVLLLNVLKLHPIPVVMKVKIVSGSGSQIRTFFVARPDEHPRLLVEQDALNIRTHATLVIEALAYLQGQIGPLMGDRIKCAHSLFSHSKSPKHVENETCRFCLPGNEEREVKEVCDEISAQSFQDLLMAAGASFTDECQAEAKKLLEHSSMKDEFERSLQFAKEHRISRSDQPSIFMVEHMYADVGAFASTQERLLDSTPQEIFERRGL